MTTWWQDIYRRKMIFRVERTTVQLILSCKYRMRPSPLCEYSMIELGVIAHKLRNFSISWNTSAQRALSLDRIGTGSNLIERQLRWLKGQHECRLRTRRSEDSRCSPNTSRISYSPTGRTKEPKRKHIYQNIYERHFEILLFLRSNIVVAAQQKGAAYISREFFEKDWYCKRILTINNKY